MTISDFLLQARSRRQIDRTKVVESHLEIYGWIPANETWTYISATSFSAPGDVTAKYPPGTRIRLYNNATTQYYYVVSATFGAGITTFVVTAGSDYALALGAITLPHYSYHPKPSLFPFWFNWLPTSYTGFLVNPPDNIYRFFVIGNEITISVRQLTDGTSNATSFRINGVPISCSVALANAQWIGYGNGRDNGAALTTAVMIIIAPGQPLNLQIFPNSSPASVWTNANGKRIASGFITYEF